MPYLQPTLSLTRPQKYWYQSPIFAGVSTAEVVNNDKYFIPPWTYNPTVGKRRKNPINKDQAMAELKEVQIVETFSQNTSANCYQLDISVI